MSLLLNEGGITTNDSAFTGLEAAIVLVAFIIVAAVFSFLVLGSGIKVTQSAQNTIYTGTTSAGSSLYPSGTIMGIKTTLTTPPTIRSIIIPVKLVGNSNPVDISVLHIRILSAKNEEELTLNTTYMNIFPKSGKWSVQQALYSDDDSLLEQGEEFVINATLQTTGDMLPNHQFTIEIKADQCTPLRIHRTIPGALDPLTPLD